jgi:hypothetical protein
MPHAFAASLQYTCGILKGSAVEESNIDMAFERVDVAERRIVNTCDRATIVHQLSDIITALPYPHKPLLRNRSQLDRAIRQPPIDSRVPFYTSGQSQDVVTTDQPAEVQRNATRSTLAHNDEVERRGIAVALTEADLSQSSTLSLAHRRNYPAIARSDC